MKKQISKIIALVLVITSLSGCATITSSMSIDSVAAGNTINEAVTGQVTSVDLKEISIGAGLFSQDKVKDDNKALIIEETAPVVTTTTTLRDGSTTTTTAEPVVTTVPESQVTVVTDTKGQTVTDSKGEAVTSVITNSITQGNNSTYNSHNNEPVATTKTPITETSKSVTTREPKTTTVTTKNTTEPKATTTTTKATTVTTKTTTPTTVEPELSEVEKARAVKLDCFDGYDNTREAEEAFLTVINDYRRANGLGEVWCDFNSESEEAWRVYFSRRFLRHLDRNDVVMHSALGSRGVCGTTEIVTVQKNSMTVGEALDNFINSPSHNSALLDPEFDGVGVLITFFEGSSDEGSRYNYDNNNNVFCLVNFCAGGYLGESYYGADIEDFEAFLSSEIRLDSFDYDCGDAGIKKEANSNRLHEYKIDGMRRTGMILQWSAEGTRLDSWWNDEVANAANTIFNNFTEYLNTGKPSDHGGSMEWCWDEDEILDAYLTAMQTAW